MGLHGEQLEMMFELLGHAVANAIPYAPFAAGEILAFSDRALLSKQELAEIRKRVNEHLHTLGYLPAD